MSEFDPEQERELVAAEYALRLVERPIDVDPAFDDQVAAWQNRLAPLFDDFGEVEPDPALWGRIQTQAFGLSNVVMLKRKVNLWRGYAVGITAVAASLALFTTLPSRDQDSVAPPTAVAQPVLAARIAPEDGPASISIAFEGDRRTAVVTPIGIAAVAGHDHELWIVPEVGAPTSLGLLAAGAVHRLDVPSAVIPQLRSGAVLAISAEPAGGSPTGLPTGPIVATGKLASI